MFGSFLPEAGKNKTKLQLWWQMVCYTQSIASNFASCTLKEIWSDAEKPRKSFGSLPFFQNVCHNPFWSSKAIGLN